MPPRGEHKDRGRLLQTSTDTLDILVRKICEDTQLMESTVRDLFAKGWEWQEGRFQKHRVVHVTDF